MSSAVAQEISGDHLDASEDAYLELVNGGGDEEEEEKEKIFLRKTVHVLDGDVRVQALTSFFSSSSATADEDDGSGRRRQ